jgi:hypothetical protein
LQNLLPLPFDRLLQSWLPSPKGLAVKKLLMLGWLSKDILWAYQALLISTRSTPPRKRSKKGSLHVQQREAFFGAKRSGFWGKCSLQKSKNHLFAQ